MLLKIGRLSLLAAQRNYSPFAGKLLQHAGTGNKALALHDKAVRSDMIYWLDRSHNNAHEERFL